MPVHFTGYMTDMRAPDADRREAQAAGGRGRLPGDPRRTSTAETSGTWGIAGGFSLHPLKNLNVWADGGMIVTDDDAMATAAAAVAQPRPDEPRRDRDPRLQLRLDSVQAVVGNWLIGADRTTSPTSASTNAAYYDARLRRDSSRCACRRAPSDMRSGLPSLHRLRRASATSCSSTVSKTGIEAKVHYPMPLYQQKGAGILRLQARRFPGLRPAPRARSSPSRATST